MTGSGCSAGCVQRLGLWLLCLSACRLLGIATGKDAHVENINRTSFGLPRQAVPMKYNVYLFPYFYGDDSNQFKFAGSVAIFLTPVVNTRALTLHAKHLWINSSWVHMAEMGHYDGRANTASSQTRYGTDVEEGHVKAAALQASQELLANPNITRVLGHESGPRPDLVTPPQIRDERFGSGSRDVAVASAQLQEDRDFLHITFRETLVAGRVYALSIRSFSGRLQSRDMNGLFFSSYKHGNETVYLAATELEPMGARLVFPCFDEPALKAQFDVAVVRLHLTAQRQYHAISNAARRFSLNIPGEPFVVDVFMTTPKMSTYLLAVCVNDFLEFASNVSHGVLYRTFGPLNRLKELSSVHLLGLKLFDWFENHFQFAFKDARLTKLDVVPVPAFAYNGMENWGLITVDTSVYYLPYRDGADSLVQMTMLLAHEMAHTWFGNLVTPAGWGDVWLSEGFASYFEIVAIEHLFPHWRVMEMTRVNNYYASIRKANFNHYGPLVRKHVVTLKDANAALGINTYAKGAAILHMVKSLLGEDLFLRCIQAYLDENAWGVVNSTNLWTTFDRCSENHGLELGLQQRMDGWLSQSGFPVLHVHRTHNATLELSQTGFPVDANDSARWNIPVTMTTSKEPNFQFTHRDVYWLSDKQNLTVYLPDVIHYKEDTAQGEIDVTGDDSTGWVLVNLQSFGYFITNYDVDNWMAIIKQLDTDHTVFPVLNRAQIISDAFNLVRAGKLELGVALRTINYLRHEMEYLPWKTMWDETIYMRSILRSCSESLAVKFEGVARSLLSEVEHHLGYTIESNDPPIEAVNVAQMALHACLYQTDGCRTAAAEGMDRWRHSGVNSINPNLRFTFYCMAVRNESPVTLPVSGFLLHQLHQQTDPQEAEIMTVALGCSKSVSQLVQHYTTQFKVYADVSELVYWVYPDRASVLAMNMVMNQYIQRPSRPNSTAMAPMIETVTMFSCSKRTSRLLSKLLESQELPGKTQKVYKKAVESLQQNRKWLDRNQEALTAWLQNAP